MQYLNFLEEPFDESDGALEDGGRVAARAAGHQLLEGADVARQPLAPLLRTCAREGMARTRRC